MHSEWFEPEEYSKTAIETIAYQIIGSAIQVHKHLGPGLLESVYQKCLAHSLRSKGYRIESQVRVPIIFDGLLVDDTLRLDLLVERTIIVELKATDELAPIHSAQLLTYLKLTNCPKGLLINFNSVRLKDGIRSLVTPVYALLKE